MPDILQYDQTRPDPNPPLLKEEALLPEAAPTDDMVGDLDLPYSSRGSKKTGNDVEVEPTPVIPPPVFQKRSISRSLMLAVLLFFLGTLPLTVYFTSQQRQLADTRSRAQQGPYPPGCAECLFFNENPDDCKNVCSSSPTTNTCEGRGGTCRSSWGVNPSCDKLGALDCPGDEVCVKGCPATTPIGGTTSKPKPVGVVPTPPTTTPANSGECSGSCCSVDSGQSGWKFSCPEGLSVGTLPDDPNVGARCMSNPTPVSGGQACVSSDPCVAEQIDVCNDPNPSNCNINTLAGFIIKPKSANCGGTTTVTTTTTTSTTASTEGNPPEGSNPPSAPTATSTAIPSPTSPPGGTCELIKLYDSAGADITQAVKDGTKKLVIGEEVTIATSKGNAAKARFRIQGVADWAENDPSKTTSGEYRLSIHIPSTLTQTQGTFEVEVFVGGQWK